MESNQITNLLTILLTVFMVILVLLIVVYVSISLKSRNKDKKKNKDKDNDNDSSNKIIKDKNNSSGPLSVFDFMEFEDVQDNMIIQKEQHKYIMVVECQGVNYDLMSEIEKNGVESGFLQFLNTLRHPVQLYVQTRTINLEHSINTYKSRVSEIERNLLKNQQEYLDIKDDPEVSEREKQRRFYSVVRQSNLYEYGRDIISDTEKMSLNRNILSKKYYVIIPYYPSYLGENKFDSSEIRSLAFSELYTRSQAIIRTLSVCGVQGKILNSRELIDLLYVAYNRDHEEDFNIERALQAQYDKLYTTSEDVYKKRIKALDKKIEKDAIEKAKEKIDQVKSEAQKEAEEKQRKMDDLIDEMAKMILESNKRYIGEETADLAIEKVEQDEAKRKRGRPKKEGSK